MKIDEVAIKQKSGVIPYYIDKFGSIQMMFMVPSNPKYGGNQYQIAKGHIEPGEHTYKTAIREGEEELGLVKSNIKHVAKIMSVIITGLEDTYNLTLFAAKIIDPDNFKTPHYETGKRAWLSIDEFAVAGRQNQQNAVKQTYNYILGADGRDI